MDQLYGEYPEEITVRLYNMMMKCRIKGVHVDEMHPDELSYTTVDVEIIDEKYESSWMDKFHSKIGMKSLNKISQQDMARGWKYERLNREQNLALAGYLSEGLQFVF